MLIEFIPITKKWLFFFRLKVYVFVPSNEDRRI